MDRTLHLPLRTTSLTFKNLEMLTILLCIYVTIGLFVFSFIENECTLSYFFLVEAFWPIVLVVYLYKYYRKQYILRWMDRCEIVKDHLIRMQKNYVLEERFPDTVYSGITTDFVIENCLEPAMKIFNLEDEPEGWRQAFHYCIRTKRRAQ